MTTKDKFELARDGLVIIQEQLEGLVDTFEVASRAMTEMAEIWKAIDERDKLRNDRRSQQRR